MDRSRHACRVDSCATPPGAADAFAVRMDAVPALGQHTDAILAELGRSGADIDSLRKASAI